MNDHEVRADPPVQRRPTAVVTSTGPKREKTINSKVTLLPMQRYCKENECAMSWRTAVVAHVTQKGSGPRTRKTLAEVTKRKAPQQKTGKEGTGANGRSAEEESRMATRKDAQAHSSSGKRHQETLFPTSRLTLK